MHLIGVKAEVESDQLYLKVWRGGRGFSVDDVGHRRHG
jgi:hypothetical protein